jgi:hypothetical protein
MATVINTPATRDSSDNGAAGWAVAVAVLLALGLLALFVWPGIVRNSAAPADTGSNINVTLPGTGGTGGGAGGGADTGGTGGTGGAGGTVTP